MRRDNEYLQKDNEALKNHIEEISSQLKEAIQMSSIIAAGENPY